jgi:vitamin B12 transporter
MPRCFLKKVFFITLLPLLLLSSGGPALAAFEEDMETLGLYYDSKDLVVSATRNPRPISQSAENITVITARDIENMGAHTLVDVFANVPGIQTSDQGGPGTNWEFIIWGARAEKHVLLMVDGVALNQQSDQFIDLRGIPIQNIERIEIVKGPGSSSWGSALGAVINIVTKAPMDDKKFGGRASFSAGERGTRDTRGELSGTVGPLGYYLFAGNLRSDGFRPNTAVDLNDFYGKLRWELPNMGSLQFTIAYDRGGLGNGDTSSVDFLDRIKSQNFFSTLSLNYPLTDRIDLDLSLRTRYIKNINPVEILSTEDSIVTLGRESTHGGSAKLTWRGGFHTLAAGFDYDHIDSYLSETDRDAGGNLTFKESTRIFSDKYGLFLNDTLSLGPFAVTPGLRYDWMRQSGDFFSPSFGVAWNPTDKITLRTYWARGYNLPDLRKDDPEQKVMTVQAGVETTYIPWLWLKATYFWNRLTDVLDPSTDSLTKQIKQGVEVEGKTVPLFNTSLSAGYTFIDCKDDETGERIKNLPRQLLKLGLHYDDKQHTFRGSLLGRYGWLNSRPEFNGKYTAMIWDLNLAKQVLNFKGTKLELFFNAHNLFNGSQYSLDLFKNTPRWFEGGVKFEF